MDEGLTELYIYLCKHINNGYMYIYTYDMDPYQPRDHWRVWGQLRSSVAAAGNGDG